MPDSAPPKRSLIARLWGFIVFLLVLAALGSSAYLYQPLRLHATQPGMLDFQALPNLLFDFDRLRHS